VTPCWRTRTVIRLRYGPVRRSFPGTPRPSVRTLASRHAYAPGRRKSGDRHAIRRAAHVVQPDRFEELNRRRVAAVLAANAELEVRLDRPALFHGNLDQLAHAGLIDRGERVLLHDLELRRSAAGRIPSRLATCRVRSA
jgi:hypothetical protein